MHSVDQERRSHPRIRIRRSVAGRIPATPIVATLLDISQSGCRAQTPQCRLEPGTTILLDLTVSRTVAGQVVWRRGDEFGVKFGLEVPERVIAYLTGEDPLDPDEEGEIPTSSAAGCPSSRGPMEPSAGGRR